MITREQIELHGFRARPHFGPPLKNPGLSRNVGRRAWLAYWRELRRAADREGSGLLPHPENAQIDCPDCEGAGEHVISARDPQDETSEPCIRCLGTGSIIDGYVDLLHLIRSKRYRLSFRGLPGRAKAQSDYQSLRRRAMVHCSGLSALSMIESAIRLDVSCRDMLTQMRVAA